MYRHGRRRAKFSVQDIRRKQENVRKLKIPDSFYKLDVQIRMHTGWEGAGRRAKGGVGGRAPLMTEEAALVATMERRNSIRDAMVESMRRKRSQRSVHAAYSCVHLSRHSDRVLGVTLSILNPCKNSLESQYQVLLRSTRVLYYDSSAKKLPSTNNTLFMRMKTKTQSLSLQKLWVRGNAEVPVLEYSSNDGYYESAYRVLRVLQYTVCCIPLHAHYVHLHCTTY
jgi:hypothetical protein